MYFVCTASRLGYGVSEINGAMCCESLSQNYRVLGVGGDLWDHLVQPPLPKQGHLQQAAQDLVQADLEYPQRRRLHNLPRQPVPVLRHPQSEEVLPQGTSYASVCAHCPLSCRWAPLKRVWPHPLDTHP